MRQQGVGWGEGSPILARCPPPWQSDCKGYRKGAYEGQRKGAAKAPFSFRRSDDSTRAPVMGQAVSCPLQDPPAPAALLGIA